MWPVDLTFIYPHWTVDAGLRWQYFFPARVLLLAAGLLWLRRWTRGPLAGSPVSGLPSGSGFFNVFPFVYPDVADHFQYLASVGVLVPVASGLALAWKRIPGDLQRLGPIVAGLLLAILVCSRGTSGMYRDAETLYRETVRRNPASWMAHKNLVRH